MKRIYGYGRRKGIGFRWQDGKNAQKRADGPVVLTQELFPVTKALGETTEEIELKIGAGLAKKSEKQLFVNDDDGETEEVQTIATEKDDIGDLPKELVGFMATDNVPPTVSETAPDELSEPED